MSNIGIFIVSSIIKIYIAIIFILILGYTIKRVIYGLENITFLDIIKDITVLVLFPLTVLNDIMWDRFINIFEGENKNAKSH
jgi:predicted permease